MFAAKGVLISGAAILLLIAGVYLLSSRSAPAPVATAPHAAPRGDNGAPDTRSLYLSAATPSFLRASLEKQFADLQAALAANPRDANAWTRLGNLRRAAGDYAGASEDWAYAAQIDPTDTASFDAFGAFYTSVTPDYPKAESYYQQAIANNSHDTTAYQDLASLYTDTGYAPGGQSATSSAIAVLEAGVQNNPDSIPLQTQLARDYASDGNNTSAVNAYNDAIQAAQSQGSTTVASQLQAEKNQNTTSATDGYYLDPATQPLKVF